MPDTTEFTTKLEDFLGLHVQYREKAGVTGSSIEAFAAIESLTEKPELIGLVRTSPSDYFTYVIYKNRAAMQFDGFAWGYQGEGPRGLAWLFEHIGFKQPEKLPPADMLGAWIVHPNGSTIKL
jgi:hypothetical protein